MKLLVAISKVPDTTAKIAFTDNNTKFDETLYKATKSDVFSKSYRIG